MKKQNQQPSGKSGLPKSLKPLKKANGTGDFPIVGIGASAGGLEALEQFFGNMPSDTGMAFVVIQHLDPNHKGIMRELLQRMTVMQVHNVTDRLTVKPDCVYIIPPNRSMSVRKGALNLFEPLETRGMRLPVDFFFRSLADDRLDQSIGIILSGMGSDGSMGLKAIKEKNGIVLVQDPASAKFDSMPNNAMEAVLADIVAPANELPAKLISIVRHTPRENSAKELEKDPSCLEQILILLRSRTGNDFSKYKKTTVYRRIERRMGIHQIGKIADYVKFLQDNQTELDILFRELLIGVTGFFRDPALWEHLREHELPALVTDLPSGYVMRAWVAGCSTGEEAFTLAMVFREAMEEIKPPMQVSLQIFATDLDQVAIDKARKGLYQANIVADLTPHRLSRFFTKVNEQYRVNSDIREMVVFAPQNVIKDPPFTKIDIISCRNLLIYMEAELQKKLLLLFHYSLNPGGLLVLGSAETNGTTIDLLSVIDSKLRIYQRSGIPKTNELLDFPSSFNLAKPGGTGPNDAILHPDNLQVLTDQLLLNVYSPASVLATNQGDILYITGNTGKYLAPAAGKATLNLFAMAREGLKYELPVMFRKALQNFRQVTMTRVPVGTNGGTLFVDVIIQQIEKPLALKGKVLVIFKDVPVLDLTSQGSKKGRKENKPVRDELEHELQRVTEELQSTREEMQTSQEELKSTNEELQSTNEELQSTNEELTTSKEEMQSLNEELHTVNIELQSKIDDSVRINNDMNNLLKSIEIATLFLDRDLKIRQFTLPATKIFKLIPSDIGRVFTDQVSDLVYPEMYNDAREVLRTLVYSEKNISTHDGRWYAIRIMPYRTLEDRIEGIVVTFLEITKMKLAELAFAEMQSAYACFLEDLPVITISLPPEAKVSSFNRKAELLFGRKSEEVTGKNFLSVFVPAFDTDEVAGELKNAAAGKSAMRFTSMSKIPGSDPVKISWTVCRHFDDNGIIDGLILKAESKIKNENGQEKVTGEQVSFRGDD